MSFSMDKFELPMPSKCEEHFVEVYELYGAKASEVLPGSFVMLGDSLTEFFPDNLFDKNWRICNRGAYGDCVGGWKYAGIIDRLDVSLPESEPSAIYLAIGTNDIVHWHRELQLVPLANLFEGYRALLCKIRKRYSSVDFYVQSVPPVTGIYSEFNSKINLVNVELEKLALEFGAKYVNLHDLLAGENGELCGEFTEDGVHFTKMGYEVWQKLLGEIIKP